MNGISTLIKKKAPSLLPLCEDTAKGARYELGSGPSPECQHTGFLI